MFISHERSIPGKGSIARPGILRLGMTACSLLIRFSTYAVIARTVGPQGFGIILFAQWLANVPLPIIGVGMSPLTNRRIAEIQSCEPLRSVAGIFRFVWRQQCRRALLYCAAYIPLAFTLSLLFKETIPLLLLLLTGLSALPLLLSNVVGMTLQGIRRYDLLAMLRLFNALLNFLLVVLTTQIRNEQMAALLLAPAFAHVVTLTIALFCIMRLLPLREALKPGPLLTERIRQSLRHPVLLFILDVIVWRELLLLILFLIHWHNTAELGFYTFSLLLCTRIMEVAPTLLTTCVIPLFSHLFPGHHYTNAYDAFVKTSCSIALLAVFIYTILTFSSPFLIVTCFGSAYRPMILPLRILLIGAVFGSIATVSLTYLTRSEQRREQVWLAIGAALVHVVLAVPCILILGMVGAAIASAIAHIISTTGFIVVCRKLLI